MMSDEDLIEAEAVLGEIEELLKSGDVDAILSWCSDVAKARSAHVTAPVSHPPPPEPDPEPVSVDEINESETVETPSGAFFGTGPDVLERVLERQEMQPHRQRFYTDRQDRFRRGWR